MLKRFKNLKESPNPPRSYPSKTKIHLPKVQSQNSQTRIKLLNRKRKLNVLLKKRELTQTDKKETVSIINLQPKKSLKRSQITTSAKIIDNKAIVMLKKSAMRQGKK